MNLKTFDAWQQSRVGLIVLVVAAVGLAYLFALLAIDSGSLLDYAITLLLLATALQSIWGLWHSRGRRHV